MTPLDAVVLLARPPVGPDAFERDAPVLDMNVHVVASEPRQFRRNHVVVGGFVDVDRWRPAPWSWRKAAALSREEISEWIPARERHGIDASTGRYQLRPDVLASTGSSDYMASIQATRLKKGMLIKVEQDLFRVLELQHVTPGNLRGFVRVKLRNIRNGSLSDQKLRSEDTLDRATLEEREMQFLYKDGEDFHFMDTGSYEQLHISTEVLGESVNYLKAEMMIQVEFYGSEPVGIELPPAVDLKVLDTAPGIKGATASAQVKPATLETGIVIQVPPFVNPGDMVKVSTDTGEYLSRA